MNKYLAWWLVLACAVAGAQSAPLVVVPLQWDASAVMSRTRVTLQVVANPPLRRGSPIHDPAWQALAKLGADDPRLALWYPYPRMGVAELLPPTKSRAFWDFSAMDPLMEDFFTATAGHPTVLSIATAPQWMFRGRRPNVPANPDAAVWNYEQGTQLRDPTVRELADYYERVARWYIEGEFRDERGVRHVSGHHYAPAYWEVFNEPEYEHNFTPAEYTRIYDAITKRLHVVDPRLKFTGMSLAVPDKGDAFFEYFLDHANHARGARLDAISYHFYALGKDGETEEQQATSFFAQADHFLDTVTRVQAIRARLSPATETQINEAGCIAADDQGNGPEKMSGKNIPSSYWSLCGAMFAYLAGRLSEQGIEVVGASQLLGYPTQYPSVSLLDWTTGLPNARDRVLQLLIDNLKPGDKLVGTPVNTAQLYAQPIRKSDGRRMVLLVNKTSSDVEARLEHDQSDERKVQWREVHEDVTSGTSVPAFQSLLTDHITLHGFAVMVVYLD